MARHHTIKRRLIIAAAVIIMVAGLGILLYPYASNLFNQWEQQKTIAKYQKEVSQIDTTKQAEMFDKAREYNEKLLDLSAPLALAPHQLTEYTDLLKTGQNNILGYINIEKIGINLPMRHGTEEETLQTAIGHLEGTSLPVGGAGSHTVLVGHSGLPSAKLFTDIDQLQIGDTIRLNILKEAYYYKVDRKKTVLPKEAEAEIEIQSNHNYITLMTCTPYGVNTHRLLVRAERYYPKPEEQIPESSGAVLLEFLIPGVILGILLVQISTWKFKQKNKKK